MVLKQVVLRGWLMMELTHGAAAKVAENTIN